MCASIGAVLFVVGMLLTSLGSVNHGRLDVWANVGLVFGLFGALYGTIVALDRSADPLPVPRRWFRKIESPRLRVIICALLGASIVVVVWSWTSSPFPLPLVAVGTLAGAALGWYGWRWARYVDF